MLAVGASAADSIAVVDSQKVMLQHPQFAQVQGQIKAAVQKAQDDAKAAIAKETDNNKKAAIFQDKRQEAALAEKKLMEPLLKDIDTAIRTVAKAKGFTVVMDSGAFFMGGTDITEAVIGELKKK
jgi:outer membrane protein